MAEKAKPVNTSSALVEFIVTDDETSEWTGPAAAPLGRGA